MTEKPLECSQCPKTICITYKEITKDSCTSIGMCSTCPILGKKLYGEPKSGLIQEDNVPQLHCAECQTTLESLEMGSSLGCSQCYIAFDKALTQKFLKEKLIPKALTELFSDAPMHRGKSPHQTSTISPIHQLATLQEALAKALQKEQYEEAAWLRDQIKEWKEKKH